MVDFTQLSDSTDSTDSTVFDAVSNVMISIEQVDTDAFTSVCIYLTDDGREIPTFPNSLNLVEVISIALDPRISKQLDCISRISRKIANVERLVHVDLFANRQLFAYFERHGNNLGDASSNTIVCNQAVHGSKYACESDLFILDTEMGGYPLQNILLAAAEDDDLIDVPSSDVALAILEKMMAINRINLIPLTLNSRYCCI